MAKRITNSPLTPAVLHILLAPSIRERHGYGIMKQVEADSQGKVTIGPGTLYGSLSRMLEAGLIRKSDKRVDPDLDDERRIYYTITDRGQQALAAVVCATAPLLPAAVPQALWRRDGADLQRCLPRA